MKRLRNNLLNLIYRNSDFLAHGTSTTITTDHGCVYKQETRWILLRLRREEGKVRIR